MRIVGASAGADSVVGRFLSYRAWELPIALCERFEVRDERSSMRGQPRVVWDALPLGKVSDTDIAKTVGYSISMVRLARKARGIAAVPRSAITDEDRALAIRLYSEGRNRTEISNITGISASYIKDLVKSKGQSRPSGFRAGNRIGEGRIKPPEERAIVSRKHRENGHKPSASAIAKSHENHAKTIEEQLRNRYEYQAKKRGLCFNLTLEQFIILIRRDCYYCGRSPGRQWCTSRKRSIIAWGIDRVENTIGYQLDNCVTCCGTCNRMKLSMSKEAFVNQCRMIAAHSV
jgi:transposase